MPDYCCTGENNPGPCESTGTCKIKNTVNGQYLCVASSPSNWVECGGDNLGKIKEIDGNSYVCLKENGAYVWSSEPKVESKEVTSQPINLFAILIISILILILAL